MGLRKQTKKESKTNIIKFEQLNLELDNLKTDTIKSPKMQETSTLKLLSCIKNVQEKNFELKYVFVLSCTNYARGDILLSLGDKTIPFID